MSSPLERWNIAIETQRYFDESTLDSGTQDGSMERRKIGEIDFSDLDDMFPEGTAYIGGLEVSQDSVRDLRARLDAVTDAENRVYDIIDSQERGGNNG